MKHTICSKEDHSMMEQAYGTKACQCVGSAGISWQRWLTSVYSQGQAARQGRSSISQETLPKPVVGGVFLAMAGCACSMALISSTACCGFRLPEPMLGWVVLTRSSEPLLRGLASCSEPLYLLCLFLPFFMLEQVFARSAAMMTPA